MPNMDVPFNGSTLIIPGAYYADNVSADLPALAPPTPPLVFLGYGYGPQPFTIQKFSSTQDLQNALRGSPDAAFIPFLATPSPQLNGAQIITFIDCSSNTQSSITLTAGTGATSVLVLTSDLYGLPSNLLQVSVATSSLGAQFPGVNSAAQSSKITLYDGYSGQTYVQDNLGAPFEMAYTGSASSASFQVVQSGGVATTLNLISANAVETQHIPLGTGNYATVGALVEFINGTGFFTANTLTNPDLPTSQLDASSANFTLPSSGVYSYQYATATINDVAWWINNHAGGLCTATVSGTPLTGLPGQLNRIMLTHFAGGTSVPPVTSGYASGFNLALTTPGWVVITDLSAAAVQQLGAQHALLASESGYGKWRRFITGSNLGDTTATTLTNAANLDAFQATYVYPGIQRADPISGAIIMRPGLYSAAAVAAMMAGNNANVPLTRKALTATAVETSLNISQIDQLQQGGVMPIAVLDQTNVPRVVSDMTTWNVDSNPENVFNQQVAERFYLAYSMVTALNPYVGTPADPYDEMKILNAAKAVLNALVYSQGNQAGVISSWDSTSLRLVYTGANQLAAISVNVVLVGQNRFITTLVDILPLNITITASSQ